MLRNIVFLLSLIVCSSLNAVAVQIFPNPDRITLRNGVQVHKDRLEKVWKAISDLYRNDKLEYYWLCRVAKECKELKIVNLLLLYKEANRYFLQHLKSSTIDFLKNEGVTIETPYDAEGFILPPEVQNIIISSYCGSGDPKIVRIQYPVSTWGKLTFTLKQMFLS